MAGELQPLAQNFKIVDENGFPTFYFIKWAQQRQIDIVSAVSAEQALQIATDYVLNYLLAHQLQEGSGIQISPDGNISNSPLISADAQEILDQISATRGAILYRGLLGWAALDPGTSGYFLQTAGTGADPVWAVAGGGGGGSYSFNPPHAADFTLFSGDANNSTLTDDADVGLVLTNANANNAGILRGGYKALPAVGTDFSVVIKCHLLANVVNYAAGGLVMYESATGKGYHFGAWSTPSNNQIRKTNINGTFGGAPSYNNRPDIGNLLTEGWYKIARVGTTLSFGVGMDGKNFITYLSEAQNTYLTTAPDRIGPGFWLSHATELPLLTVPAWYQTGF